MVRHCRAPYPNFYLSINPCYDTCWTQPSRPPDCGARKQFDHNRTVKRQAKRGEIELHPWLKHGANETHYRWAIKRNQRHCDHPYLYKQNLEDYIKSRPPSPSEYVIQRGSQKGTRIDEVPASYMTKYLIPQRELLKGEYCTMLSEATEDFIRWHPEVKSQAGPKRAKKLRDGTLNTTPAAEKKAEKLRMCDYAKNGSEDEKEG